MAKAKANKTTKRPAPKAKANTHTKEAKVIAAMKKPGGATTEVLMKLTGWQRHTVRGFVSGTLRKKLGLDVVTKREGGVTTYSLKG